MTGRLEYQDHRDLVIDHLAAEVARYEAALVATTQERDAYALLAKVALESVAVLTTRNERLQQCVRRTMQDAFDVDLTDEAAA